MVWLPVAAPQDPERRINTSAPPLTADELREIATSYRREWREAFLLSAYDPFTSQTGGAHEESRVRPPLSPIAGYRFVEETQELEADIRTDGERFLAVFAAGWRTPSIGIVKLDDHPDGEPRWYGVHVGMVGPGEIPIIAGLGGNRWEERFRKFAEQMLPEDQIRRYRFRELTTQETTMDKRGQIPLMPEEAKPKEAQPTEAQSTEATGGTPAEPTEKVFAKADAEPEEVLDAKAVEGKAPRVQLRAVEADPIDELRAQIREQSLMLKTQGETLVEVTRALQAHTAAAGDPALIRASAKETQEILERTRVAAKAEHEDRITRAVQLLASGEEPRIYSREVEFTTRALLLMEPADAEAELEKFRAREPVAIGLGQEFSTGAQIEGLPTDFDIERWRANDGELPSLAEVQSLGALTAEGKGDPVAAAYARHAAETTRRAYNG